VGTAMRTRINAGMTVHVISSAAFPWICFAAAPPGRLRNLKIVTIRSASVKTKTAVPNRRSRFHNASIDELRSVRCVKVEFGYS
jgi:hypothetical protein